MKNLLIIVLLTLSFTIFGQSGLRLVDPDAEPVIAQMTFCLPLVEANDTIFTLECDGIIIEMPMEKFGGELTIIIHPSEEDGAVKYKKTVNWYLAPKSYYRDSLNIILL